MNDDARSKPFRRILVSLVAMVVIVTAAAVVFVPQTSWWGCSHDTDLRSDSRIDYRREPTDLPSTASDIIDQVESLPGVDEFVGGAGLVQDVDSITSGLGDDIVLSDQQYNADRSNFRHISVSPDTATISWDRGQPGEMVAPRLIGDDLVTFGAVGGDDYRLTALDPADGDVRGCVHIPRDSSDDVGDATLTQSPDDSAVAVATPDGDSTALTRIDLESRGRPWTSDLANRSVTRADWYGDVIAVGHLPRSTDDVATLWNAADTSDGRTSITAVDAATGTTAWTWPTRTGDDDTARLATLVPTVEPTRAFVLAVERVASADSDEVRLIALDPDSGTEVWSYVSPADDAPVGDVTAVGDVVLFDSGDRTGALDAATGTLLWSESGDPSRNTAGELDATGPQVWGDQLLVEAESGGVVVLDAATGERSGAVEFEP
ncbi:MAG: PQQ-binding-like beta-propeller repeat protein, partial [Ilumatobacter sp.]